MNILIIGLVLIIVGLGIALFFQVRASKAQAEDGQQLLNDYQRRIDELDKLLKDYRALEQNFDNVGQGYEQALLAFDKMEEEKMTVLKAKEALEKQSSELLAAKNNLEQAVMKKKELIQQSAESILQKIDYTLPGAVQMAMQVNNILNLNDVEMETAIECDDNCMAAEITAQAIRQTGIDRIDYLRFVNRVSEEAQALMLFTNQAMVTRVLVNLLDNAIKFTTSGTISLNTTTDGTNVEFTVEDTGEGIPGEDTERIFEPFVKLNSFFDGAGVGLTVARSIARRLNGDLKLDATRASGARFIFTLPI